MHANFSPDGRYIAYTSNESGRYDVYVEPLPQSDRKWQISTNGGYEPRWRADGQEIYYLSEDRKLMAVSVSSAPCRLAPPGSSFRPRSTQVSTVSARTTSRTGTARASWSTHVSIDAAAHQRHRELAIAPSKAAMSLTGGTRLGPYQTVRVHAILPQNGPMLRIRH